MDVNSKPIGLAVLLLLLLVGLQLRRGGSSTVFRCTEEEREALLDFKSGVNDSSNRLSSWSKEDDNCCKWRGVRCNNRTGRVEWLLLRGPQDFNMDKMLQGEIRPSLLALTHLKHLDLSLNNFSSMTNIPVFLGSFKELRYLNLSNGLLFGKVPPELGNLSTLQHLDLSNNFLYVEETRWLSRLTSLQHLDMSEVSSSSHNWLHALNMLPSILEIRLSDCELDGALPSSLHNNFTSLSILDLSFNTINSTIPKWLCNLTTLSYLNLSNNQFYGHVSACLGNMTSLKYLDLMENSFNSNITKWLCNLTSLSYLDLSYNQFYGHIPACLGNMTSLKYLDLTLNSINSTITEWLCRLTSLSHLGLGYNQFYGPIPAALGNMTSLEYLDLSSNYYIDGEIPKTLANLCNLSTFRLSDLGVSGFLDELQDVFTGCMSNNLESLELYRTNLTGRMPDWLGGLRNLRILDMSWNQLSGSVPASLENLVSLQVLTLSDNKLTGNIPKTLGLLSNLTHLDLGSNNLEGIMTEEHFMNLANLKIIDVSGNPSLALKVSRGWNPPFRLDYIYMGSCLLGPQFPAWLRTQENYTDLQMSNAAISDTIPDWLWNLSTEFETLDLSHNKIGGKLQTPTSDQARELDLSDNLFSGPIPPSMWEAMPNMMFLSLSTNRINGTIPPSICKATILETLDLSNNFLSGELPKCWEKLKSLVALNLSNNNLSGGLPSSICMPNSLKSLHLGNNILSGELFSLSNCTELVELNLSQNRFNGSIPPWIGQNFSSLKILSLHSNKLSGSIPSQLSNLTALQILVLSHNQLSGFIPESFGNFTAMKFKHDIEDRFIDPLIHTESMMLSMKGRNLQYDLLLLSIVVTIDLSNNQLYGSVPKEVGKLIELVNLNLSGNQLSGEIIKEFGQLYQLETLDLSNNKFSGRIPSSLSNIYSLSNLNLSDNNLTGKIPSGDQLQTFGPSSYIGNDYLCGPPLLKKCPGAETPPTIWDGSSTYEETEGSDDIVWIYSCMAPGFVVGLLAFFGLLALKRKWRIAYFRFIDYIYDTIYMKIAINIKKLKRGMPKIGNHGLARRN